MYQVPYVPFVKDVVVVVGGYLIYKTIQLTVDNSLNAPSIKIDDKGKLGKSKTKDKDKEKSEADYLTPQQLNQYKNKVNAGEDVYFDSKEQAQEFIEKKFPEFQQEEARGRSAEGWHFDSHPIGGSGNAIEHINIYSKGQRFRVHITWGNRWKK